MSDAHPKYLVQFVASTGEWMDAEEAQMDFAATIEKDPWSLETARQYRTAFIGTRMRTRIVKRSDEVVEE